MSNINNGGPAFPTPVDTPHGNGYLAVRGMTLRDYFAAKAMQARLVHAVIPSSEEEDRLFFVARMAYAAADAMLAARSQS